MSKKSNPATHLVEGKYSIEDLVDIERLRQLFEQFSQATGFTTGFVSYPEQKILIATGWRDICTKFHRACPASAQTCFKSNIELTARLAKLQTLNLQPCGHGLADGATPVVVRGKHLASLATGQVLLQPPAEAAFRAQAQQYGYDVEPYLAALRQVPVVSPERLKGVLAFLSGVAVLIAEQALNNLQLRQTSAAMQAEMAKRKRTQAVLEEARRLSDSLIDSMPGIFYLLDRQGRRLRWNKTLEQLLGASPKRMLTRPVFAFVHPEDRPRLRQVVREVFKHGYAETEARLQTESGAIRHFLFTGRKVRLGRRFVLLGNGLDITERKGLEQDLLQISEREQRRIALDLHDGLCQQLVGIAFTAGALQRDLARQKHPEAKTARLIGDLLDAVLTDARRLSRGLHPVMAEANGFMSALNELAGSVSKLFHIRCRFRCPKPVLVHDNAAATHLFRIAQEAVNNAIKHGKATQVTISLSQSPRTLTLQVRDNGTGLPRSLPERRGLGLQIMNYRAGMVGGAVQVRRPSGGGTVVRCTLPRHRTRAKA